MTAYGPTSCGSAMAVAQQALVPGTRGRAWPPDPTVTAPWGATTLTVISTAAGETCTLACSAGTARNLGEYRGGDGVYIMFEKKSAPMCLLRRRPPAPGEGPALMLEP